MTDENPATSPRQPRRPAAQSREDRLKAALKANMARRKAQARARTDDDPPVDEDRGGGPD